MTKQLELNFENKKPKEDKPYYLYNPVKEKLENTNDPSFGKSEEPIKKMANKIVDKSYQQNKNKNPFTQAAENAKNMLSFKMQDGHIENQDGRRINTVKEAIEVNEALDKNFQDHKQDDYIKLADVPILNRDINQIAKTNPTVQRYKNFKEDKKYRENFDKDYSDKATRNHVRGKINKNKLAGKKDYEGLATHDIIVAEDTKERARAKLKSLQTPFPFNKNLDEISKGISLLEQSREEIEFVNNLKNKYDRIIADQEDDTHKGIGSILNLGNNKK